MNALATIARGVSVSQPPTAFGEIPNLAVFRAIPHRHDVATLNGMVVVYDIDAFRWDGGLEDGGYYVIEHQHPRAGMGWETHRRFECKRLDVRREVVRAFRRPEVIGNLWWYGHAYRAGPWADGPMEDFNLTDMIVGKVVGVYVGEAAQ